jgi:hypothetical protein
MTVRPIPTESDGTAPIQMPELPDASSVGAESQDPTSQHPATVDATAIGDGRRALREARRQRRRTAWWCAAVVALCLALTIVVVNLARYRPVTPPAALASASPPHPVSTRTPPLSAPVHSAEPASDPFLGAPAPGGGTP